MEVAKTGKQSNVGNVYLVFLGLFLVIIGGAFTLLMWLSFQRANTTRQWDELPCVIESSTVTERQLPGHSLEYQWQVEYSYSVGEVQRKGTKQSLRGSKWTSKDEKIEVLLENYPEARKTVCYVNPENSAQAILEHDSRGAGYSIWFPMLFAIGGVGMIVGALRKWN